MPDREPVDTTNLDRYGNPPLPWSRVHDLLMFLSTVRPDGQPSTAGIGAVWHDGDLYFTSGPATRKSRNLAEHPACTIAMRQPGVDLVFSGEAERTTDPVTLETLAARYRADGWPAEVADDALTAPYSAPSAGAPPWFLYRLTIHTIVGVATTEPGGATRWRFAE